jgi:hypothetical protein
MPTDCVARAATTRILRGLREKLGKACEKTGITADDDDDDDDDDGGGGGGGGTHSAV